ncbi:unnamed protein product [Citrullus colocynthis]|uniref:Uncharacterized protein n=1 Tax=Citrullus colocynthis TaxID=252529 RepID=A0ABP0XY38_9ROSI
MGALHQSIIVVNCAVCIVMESNQRMSGEAADPLFIILPFLLRQRQPPHHAADSLPPSATGKAPPSLSLGLLTLFSSGCNHGAQPPFTPSPPFGRQKRRPASFEVTRGVKR